MTTNKPEVKRYDCTSDDSYHCHGCFTMKEHLRGNYVEWEDYEALRAELESLKEYAELGKAVQQKREPGKRYGCHCDLEEGMEPDGCVIDSNEHLLCIYAKHISAKEQCKYWQVITSDANQEH